jgi:hypothetical protein
MPQSPSAAARAALSVLLLLGCAPSAPALPPLQTPPAKAPAEAPAPSQAPAQPSAKTGSAAAAPAQPAGAQPAGQAAAPKFKEEDLVQVTAPIALYPDDLVAQILMASTYPLECIEAYRFTEANKKLQGDALSKALNEQDWDPSVKSLVQFPSVLKMMNDKLDWTQKLGDAFLAQQKEVMDTIQKLRAKAQAEGNLKSNEQQKVTVEKAEAPAGQPPPVQETVIKIESTKPEVIYVPTYNPTVVYGSWPYPAYPPYYYTPPGYVAAASFVSFGIGVACGAAWGWAMGGCGWGHGEVDIDVNKNVNFNNNINRTEIQNNLNNRAGSTSRTGTGATSRTGSGKSSFQHDPSHRKGASYRDSATAQKFGKGASTQQTQARESFRGRADQGRQSLSNPANREAANKAVSSGNRAGGSGSASRSPGSSAGNRAGGASAGSRDVQRSGSGGSGRSSAFQGSGSGRQTSAQSSRGRSSRSSGSSGMSRGGGGGSRGGGGRGGGGRR